MRRGPVRRATAVMAAWGPEERDAVLYSASALFAIGTAQWASIPLYQQWGRLAVGPYAAGAVASALTARHAARRAGRAAVAAQAEGRPVPVAGDADGGPGPRWHWTTPRALILLVVLLGATLVPLSLEVLWRADGGGATNVQPEVPVVERSGTAFVHGKDPYQDISAHARVVLPAGQPAYEAYNPYLPLMALFGGPRSTHAPARLTDARVVFEVFTIVVVVVAMALCRGPTGPRVLALQSMTVLPTAALPLATGGDDVPVAALLLLGLVLLQRRRPLWAGAVLGVAASMKITAWPLAALAFLVARDRDGQRGRRPSLMVLVGLLGVMIPAVLPTAAENIPAFVDNVVRFPLGLAGVHSPAGSALLGHTLVSAFPAIRHVFPVAVAGAGGAVLCWVLARRRPTTPAGLSSLIGWVMAVAILLAPATRVGYLLYPIDLFVWAWLLRGEESVEERPTALVGAGVGGGGAPRDEDGSVLV
ncbi:MAG TPA: glycosyltransferase 87 family protein [Acidimicrobiales bacterium]|nr:glycosyltransferase 87 family protein [Acidimicrobiales bacterium]